MLVGYARVSTQDQKPELQFDALKAAGCEKVFVEKPSGAQRERPELKADRAMLADKSITVEEVAKHLRVSPATLYRHLPAARAQGKETGGAVSAPISGL